MNVFDPRRGPVLLTHTSGARGQAMRYTPETIEYLADWIRLVLTLRDRCAGRSATRP